MIKPQVSCDVCQCVKQKSNHWWIFWVDFRGCHFCKWDDSKAIKKGANHVCGFECSTKMLGRYMEEVVAQSIASIDSKQYSEEVSG